MELAAQMHESSAALGEDGAHTAAGDAGPLRRCIVTRDVLPKAELVRFVLDPAATVVPDIEGRLPGRGLWLRADRDIVTRAVRKNLFAKVAGTAVKAPDDLAEQVERLLARRCLELLGLARRAGQAVAGFEKVHGWLAAGRVGLLLAASDGGADARRKLASAARGDVTVVAAFSGAELAGVLGREAAVAHVAIAPGGIARRLAQEARRLAGLRGLRAAGAAEGTIGGGGGVEGPRQH
jgi:predicted RNA-binding protein YlxR (DUF448 family)